MMDRSFLQEHLVKAEEHVAIGIRNVERQRQIVVELLRDGHDVSKAQALLTQFEELLAMHIAERDRLVQQLSA